MKPFSFEKEETVTDRGMLEWNVRIHTKDRLQIWILFIYFLYGHNSIVFVFNMDEVHCMAESVWTADTTLIISDPWINLSQLALIFLQ